MSAMCWMRIRFRLVRESLSTRSSFLQFSRASYITLNNLIGGMTVIPPMPVQDVEQAVWQHASKHLPSTITQNELAADLVGKKDRD